MGSESKETSIQNRILVECAGGNVRLWRNHRGSGYQGKATRFKDGVLISHASQCYFGLCNGASDIIGFKTEEYDGIKVAIFVAIEVKTSKGRVSPDQQKFIEMIQSMGGIAGVARSVEEAKEILGIK